MNFQRRHKLSLEVMAGTLSLLVVYMYMYTYVLINQLFAYRLQN